jgi:hypothetical protein
MFRTIQPVYYDQRFDLSVHGILESHANPIRNVGAVYDKQLFAYVQFVDNAENQQHVQCGLFMGLCCPALGRSPIAKWEPSATRIRQNIPIWPNILGRWQIVVIEPVGEAGVHVRPALLYVAAPLLGLVYNDRFPQPCYK